MGLLPFIVDMPDLKLLHIVVAKTVSVPIGGTASIKYLVNKPKLMFLSVLTFTQGGVLNQVAVGDLKIDGVPVNAVISASSASRLFYVAAISQFQQQDLNIPESLIPFRDSIEIQWTNTSAGILTATLDIWAYVHDDLDNEFQATSVATSI